MSTHDQDRDGVELGASGQTRRRFTRTRSRQECDHPHARTVNDELTGEPVTVLVCETCGAPLDARDPTLRRRQRLDEVRVCVSCGGTTYWTTGARRGV